MGTGTPAPIEEDVPPEFFSDKHMVMTAEQMWNSNWRPSIENFSDAHVYYVHRNSIEMLTRPTVRSRAHPFRAGAPAGHAGQRSVAGL